MIDRRFIRVGHAAGGTLALLLILTFQSSTIVSELSGNMDAVVAVKAAILRAMVLLVLALASAGASGMWLSGGKPRGLAARKFGRMKIAAAIGLVVLVPAAIFLAARAAEGRFDAVFYLVQVAEILAGLVNLALIGLNLRDGLRMAAGRRAIRG
jgi:hypothetical protein